MHRLGIAHDPGVDCCVLLARSLWVLGCPDHALEWSRRARDLARDLAHPFTLAYVLFNAARVHQHRREARPTRELAEAAIALATERRFPFWLPIGEALRARAALACSQGADALAPQIRSAVARRDAMGTEFEKPYLIALRAEVLAEGGGARRASKRWRRRSRSFAGRGSATG